MTEGQALDLYYVAKLHMHAKDGTGPIELWLSNRPLLEADEGDVICWPIIKAMRGFGVTHEDSMPVLSPGNLVLDNSHGSIGIDRRISDFLQHYTPINQEVYLYFFAVPPGTNPNLENTPTSIWKDRIQTFRIDARRQEITLNTKWTLLDDRVLTREVDIGSFPNAPEESLGKHVPLVFGCDSTNQDYSVIVEPVQIDDTPALPVWAYCTTFADQFVPYGPLDRYYFVPETDPHLHLFTPSSGSNYGESEASGYGTTTISNGVIGWATKFVVTNPCDIICAFDYKMDVQSTTSDQVLQFHIWSSTPNNNKPSSEDILASSDEIDVSSLSVGTYTFSEPFTKVLILHEGTYWFGWTINAESAYNVRMYTHNTNTSTGNAQLKAGGTPKWDVTGVSNKEHYWLLYGINDSSQASQQTALEIDTTTGKGICQFSFSHSHSTVTEPALNELRPYPAVSGIRDDSSGTITGVVNGDLEGAHQVAELLTWEWNGTDWVSDSNFSSALHNDTHLQLEDMGKIYARRVMGAVRGRGTRLNVLGQIMRQQACTFTKSHNNVSCYAWGEYRPLTLTIDDDRLELLDYYSSDMRGVVNCVLGVFDRVDGNTDFNSWLSQNGFRNYTNYKTYKHDDGGRGEFLAHVSDTNFGPNCMAENRFDWISDPVAASSVFEWILRTHDMPSEWVRISVPLLDYYNSLDPMDVIGIKTTQLPAHFGTAATPPHPEYTSTPVTRRDGGHLIQAQMYRGQIYGMHFDFAQMNAPKLILTCRLLIHPNDPSYGNRID